MPNFARADPLARRPRVEIAGLPRVEIAAATAILSELARPALPAPVSVDASAISQRQIGRTAIVPPSLMAEIVGTSRLAAPATSLAPAVAHVALGAALPIAQTDVAARAHSFSLALAVAHVAFGAALPIGQSDFAVGAAFPRRPSDLARRAIVLAAAAQVRLGALRAPRQPSACD